MNKTLLIFSLVAGSLATHAAARDTLTVNETDLRSFEYHDEVLLTLSKPLYRLGEILELGNGGGYVVPVEYHWTKNHWEYICRPVRVGERKTNAK